MADTDLRAAVRDPVAVTLSREDAQRLRRVMEAHVWDTHSERVHAALRAALDAPPAPDPAEAMRERCARVCQHLARETREGPAPLDSDRAYRIVAACATDACAAAIRALPAVEAPAPAPEPRVGRPDCGCHWWCACRPPMPTLHTPSEDHCSLCGTVRPEVPR